MGKNSRMEQGRGLGSALLRDAVQRVVGAAETIGVRALLVHAISDEAKTFYEHQGFRASAIEPDELDRGSAEDAQAGVIKMVWVLTPHREGI